MHCIVFVACVTTLALVQGQDDCMPKLGEKRMAVHHGECCSADFEAGGFDITKLDTCRQKYPHPPRPTGPPPTGLTGPPPELKNHRACMSECIFGEKNLLTADKQLDAAAIAKTFVSSDASLGPVVKAAVDKCLASYKSNVDQSMECMSGADEFKSCLGREVFLNCPAGQWTESTDCAELKAKTTKCTKMPVMLGKMPPRGPPPQ